MHAISIHIDENINRSEADALRREMMASPYVRNVEMSSHDMLVEFDEHHNMPMNVLNMLKSHGLHADIVGC